MYRQMSRDDWTNHLYVLPLEHVLHKHDQEQPRPLPPAAKWRARALCATSLTNPSFACHLGSVLCDLQRHSRHHFPPVRVSKLLHSDLTKATGKVYVQQAFGLVLHSAMVVVLHLLNDCDHKSSAKSWSLYDCEDEGMLQSALSSWRACHLSVQVLPLIERLLRRWKNMWLQ